MNAKERMQELVSVLNDANYRYYVLDDPQIPDFEYDRLLREFRHCLSVFFLPFNSFNAGSIAPRLK